jgi:hypothetical protein
MNCMIETASAYCNVCYFGIFYWWFFISSMLIALHYIFTKCECGKRLEEYEPKKEEKIYNDNLP